jgi:ATP-binding cassette, subfamily C (CFTR/MRP), member 1
MFGASFQLRWEIMRFDSENFMNGDITWESFQFINYCTYFALISIMLILSLFADKEPQHSSYPKFSNPNPELRSGGFLKLFFAWLDPTVWKGYRRPLIEQDIYDINPEYSSAILVPPFDRNFLKSVENSEKRNAKKASNNRKTDDEKTEAKAEGSVLYALSQTFGGPFLFALLLRFIADFLQFGSPIVLGALIRYVEADGPLWQGLVLTAALFLISFVIAMLNGHQSVMAYKVGFSIRTSLVSAIYRKALKISSLTKRNTTIGEIVNLMAVDSHRFFEMVPYLHFTLTAPFVMGLAIFLIFEILGVAVFAGLAVLLLMFPISGFIANKLKNLQFIQMKVKDERVKSISEILNGIKVLKLYAWEPSFQELIENTRDKEIEKLKEAAMYNAATEFIWGLTPFLVSFVSFTTFVMLGNRLDADIAFVSIALFNILRMPMTLCELVLNFEIFLKKLL